jgi:hypothetical protein
MVLNTKHLAWKQISLEDGIYTIFKGYGEIGQDCFR